MVLMFFGKKPEFEQDQEISRRKKQNLCSQLAATRRVFQAMAIQRMGCILWGCELVSIDLCRKT
jgi:hypothetical protein